MTPSVLILSGGLATRLRPLTENIPKALIDIHGKPFLQYQLELLKKQGFQKIVLSIGYEGKQIEDALGDGRHLGMEISYSYDGDTLLGTGGAVQKALPLLTDPFLVLYGDSYLEIDYPSVLESFSLQQQKTIPPPLGLMTVYQNQNLFDRSNVVFVDGIIQCYDKKNQTDAMKHIDWGLGILSQEAFLPFAEKTVFDLASVYEKWVEEKRLMGFEVFQRFYEIGSFEGIETFRDYMSPQQHPVL